MRIDWEAIGTLDNEPRDVITKPMSEEATGVRPVLTGTEAELEERWRKLLYAESKLQQQRSDLADILAEGGDPDVVLANLKEAIEEQSARPCPDYRALLVNTHRELKKIMAAKETLTDVMPFMKEAIRLTDVERLEPWDSSLQGIALRAVMSEVYDALDRGKHYPEDYPMQDTKVMQWVEDTMCDLVDARDNPEAYLARRARRCESKMTPGRVDLHLTELAVAPWGDETQEAHPGVHSPEDPRE